MGLTIADCQLAIFDWRVAIKPIDNQQSQIDNPETYPLPQVVLTSRHSEAGGSTNSEPGAVATGSVRETVTVA